MSVTSYYHYSSRPTDLLFSTSKLIPVVYLGVCHGGGQGKIKKKNQSG